MKKLLLIISLLLSSSPFAATTIISSDVVSDDKTFSKISIRVTKLCIDGYVFINTKGYGMIQMFIASENRLYAEPPQPKKCKQ